MEAILCKRAMELENWTENQRREETSIKWKSSEWQICSREWKKKKSWRQTTTGDRKLRRNNWCTWAPDRQTWREGRSTRERATASELRITGSHRITTWRQYTLFFSGYSTVMGTHINLHQGTIFPNAVILRCLWLLLLLVIHNTVYIQHTISSTWTTDQRRTTTFHHNNMQTSISTIESVNLAKCFPHVALHWFKYPRAVWRFDFLWCLDVKNHVLLCHS
jgi:hypothetical protein